MSATATLTNCYVPLPVPSSSSPTSFDPFDRPSDDYDGGNTLSHSNADDGDDNSKQQKRGPRTLRQIHLDRSILSQSTGSSLVEWGYTKLMVSVRGPRPVNCSSMNAANNGGGLVCEGELGDSHLWLYRFYIQILSMIGSNFPVSIFCNECSQIIG